MSWKTIYSAKNAFQHTLTGTNLKVGRFGIGTGSGSWRKNNPDQKEVDEMLSTMLDNGSNFIDTSADYNDSEIKIGKVLKNNRKDFVVLTKCGHKMPGITGEEWSEKLIKQSINRSLKRLQTDYLDIVLLHSCDMEILKKGEALGALCDLVKEGKIRYVGYSGDNEELEFACQLPDVSVLELSLNVVDMANAPNISKIQQNNKGIIIKRTVCNGAWKGKRQYSEIKEYASEYADRIDKIGIKPSSIGWKSNSDKNWVEMNVEFVLAHGVDVINIGTSKLEHLKEDLDIVNSYKGIDDDDKIDIIYKMWEASQKDLKHFRTGQRWTGQI